MASAGSVDADQSVSARGSNRARWDWLIPIGLVALGPLALFGPMLAEGKVLYWGTPLLQFTPWHSMALEMVREGVWPVWDPLVGMGAPLLANHQSALLYPPNWLLALADIAWGQTLLVLAHLVFAGVGMILLLRHLGRTVLSQVVGGIAFASGAFLVARSGFLSLNAAAAWLPWLVLAADHLGRSAAGTFRRSVGPILAVAIVLTLEALAGHAQTLAYSAILGFAWSCWRTLTEDGSRGLGKLIALWIVAGGLAAAAAGAQLLPTAEYYLQSSRSAGLDETAALTYSFWPWRSLGIVLPGLFGNPALGDYWGYGNYWEDALYVGILPLGMAALAVVRAGRLGKPNASLRTFLVGASAVAFFFGLGQNTGLFNILFRYLPLFGIFNAPTRWNLITTFCLALLAAIGADLWGRPTGRALYWTRLGTAAAVAAIATGVAAGFVPLDLHGSFGRSVAIAGVWCALAGALTLAWPQRGRRAWVAIVAVVITADLFVANFGSNPSAPASLYRGRTALAGSLGTDHRVFLTPEAERVLKFDRTHRFDSYQTDLDPRLIRESGLPNTLLLDRIPSANNFDPLIPDRYGMWLQAVAGLSGERLVSMLALADVGWEASRVGNTAPWAQYVPVGHPARVRVVPRAIVAASPEDSLELVTGPGFDPDSTVALEGAEQEIGRVGGAGAARITDDGNPTRVVVEVRAPSGGWLVLSDAWYPGWMVEVDGISATPYAADGVFRAVWLPPGSSTVVWSYKSAAVRGGALASAAGLLILAGLGLWWGVRRRSG